MIVELVKNVVVVCLVMAFITALVSVARSVADDIEEYKRRFK